MVKRMYFNTCDKCGAHLDPGEKCDCTKELEHNPDRDKRRTHRPVIVYDLYRQKTERKVKAL